MDDYDLINIPFRDKVYSSCSDVKVALSLNLKNIDTILTTDTVTYSFVFSGEISEAKKAYVVEYIAQELKKKDWNVKYNITTTGCEMKIW